MHGTSDISVTPLGEAAWVVTLGDRVSESVHLRVMSVLRSLQDERARGGWPEVVSVTPAFTTVTVQMQADVSVGWDQACARRTAFCERLLALARAALSGEVSNEGAVRRWIFPVCLDPPHAPDLGRVAEAAQVPQGQVVDALLSREFRVHMLGFLPGFAYMGTWPQALAVPRRATPRMQVPAGSVAVAETFCAIYPWDSPGGWHLLGHMPLPLFDVAHPDGPCWLQAGDQVRFRRVDVQEWAHLQEAVDRANRAGRPWDRQQHAVGALSQAAAQVPEAIAQGLDGQAVRQAVPRQGRTSEPETTRGAGREVRG